MQLVTLESHNDSIANVLVVIFGAVSIAIAFASKELGGSLAQVSLCAIFELTHRIQCFGNIIFSSLFHLTLARFSDILHAAGQSFRTAVWCLPRRSFTAVCAREGEGC